MDSIAEQFIEIIKIALPVIIIFCIIALCIAKRNKRRATGDNSKDYAILGIIIGVVVGGVLGYFVKILGMGICIPLGILVGYVYGSNKKKS